MNKLFPRATLRLLGACLIASGAAGGGVGGAQAADLLVNGGFELQPNWGQGISGDAGYTLLTGNQIPGWTIEAGHGATVHNTALYPTISGSYSINMDGEGYLGGNANLYQDFASAAGTAYRFSYDWSTWYGNTQPNLDVSIIDTVTSAVIYDGNFAWSSGLHSISTTFAGTGHTLRLRLQELPQSGFNDNSYMVDNFSIVAVPEVPTLGLMAGGLALLAVARRRLRG